MLLSGGFSFGGRVECAGEVTAMKRIGIVTVFSLLVVLGAWIYVRHSAVESGGAVTPEASGSSVVQAPQALPAPVAQKFKDTSMLRPPAGATVAIYEFDDLECPSCAHALPILHAAAAQYKIPIVHHDFPLTEIHLWSLDAAVTARYLQDKVAASTADEFRRDVFAHQNEITGKDDLARFTQSWFDAHGQKLPFVLDADGNCHNEVAADRALGERLGVPSTPCIFVVTEHGFAYVADVSQLYQTIDAAMAEMRSAVSVVERERQS